MDRGTRRAERGFDTSRPGESFVEVVRGVLVEPARFFAGLGEPDPDRVKGPLVFALICYAVSLPLSFLVAPFDPLMPERADPTTGLFSFAQDNLGLALALAVLFLILLPLLAVLGVYLGAAIQHFFVFLFVKQRRGYWGTFPVVAYGSALALLSWVPVLGYLATLYGVYVTALGLREMHGTSTVRALLAALVPALIGLASTLSSLASSSSGA